MMKKIISKLLIVALLIGTVLGCLSACDLFGGNEEETTTKAPEETTTKAPEETTTKAPDDNSDEKPGDETPGEENPPAQSVDYAASIQLDMNSDTLKKEVTVKIFIDGDTTHFYLPDSSLKDQDGKTLTFVKARYLAVNTPESTGKIEEWGKKASAFTKEKLSTATSIILESDDSKLNADSTGDRYLFWVWYKPAGSDQYRNLNIEILQNGLAIASNSANNRYGSTCMAAINQAKTEKLCVHSGQKDPDFYYGEAEVITLKELRCNIASYLNKKVAFTGVITQNCDNAVYIESFDEETNVWYGMYIYYGFNLNGAGMEIISVGNEARIVGSVQYYEAGGTYQVSDLSYRVMKPDDPTNIKKLSDGHTPVYLPTTPEQFVNGKVDVTFTESEETQTTKTYKYAELALYSSIQMEGLKVTRIWTTVNEDSSNKGAMTLTCEANGLTVTVRTTVFKDADGNLITESAYLNKTINVRGIIEYYDGGYQIKVFTPDAITIQ